MKFLLLFFLFLEANCFAGTYYIDFAGGSDTNSGTSKSSAWKRHPYMPGWAGSYTHTSGDHFIFKGGVTWNNTCFPIITSFGGSNGNPDVFTVDSAWFANGAWSQPVFDLTGTLLTGSGTGADMIRLNGSNVTIDNFLLTGIRYAAGSTPTGINIGTSINIRITYCTFTNFAPASGTSDTFQCIKGYTASPFNAGSYVGYCTFDNSAQSGLYGYACYYAETFEYNTVHDMPNGFVGVTQVVRFNKVYNILTSADASQHENALYAMVANNGSCRVYGNTVYNVQAGTAIYMTLLNVSAGNTGTFYCYNNRVYGNQSGVRGIETDPEPNGAGTRGTAYIWNNTVQTSANALCFRFGPRTSAGFSAIHLINNHGICEGSLYGVNDTYVTLTQTNNTTQTNAIAASQGYLATETQPFSPTSKTCATVDNGTTDTETGSTTDILNLSRPQGSTIDVGAYEYATSGAPSNAITSIKAL